MNKSQDDERLLAALREAIAARAAVPAAFVEAAKNAYAWRHIEAELAQLTYDSRDDAELSTGMRSAEVSASMRSQAASIRALTFASPLFCVEVEITDDVLLGQLIPPQPGTVEIQALAGETSRSEIDETGCFSIEPKPQGQFRLRCRTHGQPDVLTGWLVILNTGAIAVMSRGR